MYHSTHTIIHLHIPRLLLVPLWHLVVLASCHEPRKIRRAKDRKHGGHSCLPRQVDGSSSLRCKRSSKQQWHAWLMTMDDISSSLGWSATCQPDLVTSDALRGNQNSPGGNGIFHPRLSPRSENVIRHFSVRVVNFDSDGKSDQKIDIF